MSSTTPAVRTENMLPQLASIVQFEPTHYWYNNGNTVIVMDGVLLIKLDL